MSRRNTKSQAVVESLLDERRQYQEWLDKLAAPGAAGAPSPVVERVRADYQSRLDNVTRQLARHEGELETALAEVEMRRDLAAGQRTARQDALAEAALRHEVGEHDDEKFAALSAEHASFLAQLAENIEFADRDITRLEEVLGLIARVLPETAPPPSAPAAPATPAAPAAPSAVAPLTDGEVLGNVAAHLGGLDELSFLRSVAAGAKNVPAEPSGGSAVAAEVPASPPLESPTAGVAAPKPGPAPEPVRPPRLSRPVMPSAAAAAAAAAAPPPQSPPAPKPEAQKDVEPRLAPEPSPVPKPEPRPKRAPESRSADLPLPSPLHHIVPEIPEAKPSARDSKRGAFSAAEAADNVARKTLRCTECGTVNLPTEWYCEKCGAELSAF